ncbi:hypothetical protein GCM10023063_28340 [Arthrobacter methylotrophus]|uniref:Uncharacterized protein n=1 Tax=Arthrobacter methylotrophus TaxID=121291 RepID=A0ABV5UQH5_9MICC
MTAHAYGRAGAKHASSRRFAWLTLLARPVLRKETFADYVSRVDAVLDDPKILAKALALKPSYKLPKR